MARRDRQPRTSPSTRTSSARDTSKRPAFRSCAAGISPSWIAQRRSRSPFLMRPLRGSSSATTSRSAGVAPARQGPTSIEVVGVVENAKYLSVREAPIPTVPLPFRGGSPMTLHVKTRADPRSALRVINKSCKPWIQNCRSFRFRPSRRAWTMRLSGTAGGDVGDDPERVGHAHRRCRHLRPDQLLGSQRTREMGYESPSVQHRARYF